MPSRSTAGREERNPMARRPSDARMCLSFYRSESRRRQNRRPLRTGCTNCAGDSARATGTAEAAGPGSSLASPAGQRGNSVFRSAGFALELGANWSPSSGELTADSRQPKATPPTRPTPARRTGPPNWPLRTHRRGACLSKAASSYRRAELAVVPRRRRHLAGAVPRCINFEVCRRSAAARPRRGG